MDITVLGNCGTCPGKNGACSGYLLQKDGVNILIDCGNGTIGRFFNYCDLNKLDAIILTHLHRDHTSDMHVFKYAVDAKIQSKGMKKGIDVYLPSSPKVEYDSLIYNNVYNLFTIQHLQQLDIKGVKITFFQMNHPVECYGIRVESKGKTFSYTGDTIFNNNIKSLAQDADFFLCEATATENMKRISPGIPHLTPKEAASIALDAKVKLLALTHFWYEEDRKVYLEEASAVFKNTILSEEGKVYRL